MSGYSLFHFLSASSRMLFWRHFLRLYRSRRLGFCFLRFLFRFGLSFLERVKLPWIKRFMALSCEIHHKLGFYKNQIMEELIILLFVFYIFYFSKFLFYSPKPTPDFSTASLSYLSFKNIFANHSKWNSSQFLSSSLAIKSIPAVNLKNLS